MSALEYVLAAIGADLVNGLQTLGRRRRVAIEQVEAVVEGELNNPLTYLGVVGETGHPGLEKVRVRVYLASPEEEAVIHVSGTRCSPHRHWSTRSRPPSNSN